MKILLVALVKDFIKAKKRRQPKGTIFFRLPSLALANIAAHTPKENEIIVADEQISPVDFNLKVDLVAISVNTSIAHRAFEIADRFRSKGIKVVFGGIHPSLQPDEALKHADSIVIGDAEGQWEKLLIDFKNNKLKKMYANSQTQPLDNLPTPRWNIFKGMGYITTNIVEATRGCPYHCSFCSTAPFYHHHHRTRPIKDVIRDIKSVISFPKKLIVFADDNIVANKTYARKLFKALIPLHIYWGCQATVDIADDPELVKLAAKSGCFALFLGLESVSQRNIDLIGKKHNQIARYKQSIELLHKNGIGVEVGYIFGFDYDTPEAFKETFDFVKDAKIDALLTLYLTPIPGTTFFEDMSNQKRLITRDYSKYDFRHVVFKPKNVSPKEIYNGVSWITGEFYSKSLTIKRVFYKIREFLLHPSVRRLIGVVALIAFSLASRKRIKDYSIDGTFPRSLKHI